MPKAWGGMSVTIKGAERDAAVSILLQEALTCGFLLVFCVGKAELEGDTTMASHQLRGLLDW